MSVTFTKLFSSITESTVWCEPAGTRLTWITMLAMADRQGRVWASMPGLAHRARVTETECQIALDTFLAPDRHSRTVTNEGKRIEEIDGGWRLLNYQKYRDMRDKESEKESKRAYINKRRANEKKNITIRANRVDLVTFDDVEKRIYSRTSDPLLSNQAEADAEVNRSTPQPDAVDPIPAKPPLN